MARWTAEWTGESPTLCFGEWILYRDGEPVETGIPFQGHPANTEGTYDTWYFEDWKDVWETYDDGMTSDEWITEYRDWLETLTDNVFDLIEIYRAFQEHDWRYNSCGGCI